MIFLPRNTFPICILFWICQFLYIFEKEREEEKNLFNPSPIYAWSRNQPFPGELKLKKYVFLIPYPDGKWVSCVHALDEKIRLLQKAVHITLLDTKYENKLRCFLRQYVKQYG